MARDFGSPLPIPSFEETRLKKRAIYNRKAATWAKTGGYCYHCGAALTFSGGGCFQMDHLIALANGGADKVENLVPSCAHCNASKWKRPDWTVSQRRPKRPTRWERQMARIRAWQ